MPARDAQWVPVIGAGRGGLPPALRTNAPAATLAPNEIAAGTGLSATAEGFLAAGTIPTGSARVARRYTGVTTPGAAGALGSTGESYVCQYNRLWRAGKADYAAVTGEATNELLYGAPDYTARYYEQGRGRLVFDDDAQPLLTSGTGATYDCCVPIGETGLVVFKSTGAYLIPNAASRAGNFGRVALIEEAAIASLSYATELDGTVYFARNGGLYSMDASGAVRELSESVRGQVTAAALTVDYQNKLILVGSAWCYDVPRQRFLKYSGSTFSVTSRALVSGGNAPFAVDAVGFVFSCTATRPVELSFQYRFDEARDWSLVQTLTVENTRGEQAWTQADVSPETGRAFQVRLTAMDATLKLREVQVRTTNFDMTARDD